MKVSKESMRLYIVTDRTWLKGKSLASQVEESVAAGATFVQLREKDASHEDFLHCAREVKAVTDRYGIPFVINDNIDVMLACGADGVHIGQKDLPASEARKRIGPDKILGVSANTVESALAAQRDGADYLGVGAVFSTSTKLDAKALDHGVLRDICAAVSIPVVAIGGIHTGNILQLKGSGIDGVAVVSAVFAQPDIPAATKKLLALSNEVAG